MSNRPAIYNLIDAFCELVPDAEWSFGHVVLSDYNLGNDFIHGCLDRRREWLVDQYNDLTRVRMDVFEFAEKLDELIEKSEIISQFLLFLLTIPEESREVEEDA